MTADILLYRRSLALKSGAGRLMLAQAAGLEAAGASVAIGGSRGRLKFMLASGRYPRRLSVEAVRALARRTDSFIVDHDLTVPAAGVVFVHNLQSSLDEFLPNHVAADVLAAERAFFEQRAPDSLVVANSDLVRKALVQRLGVPARAIVVHHPGFDARRFAPATRQKLRVSSRAALGIDAAQPLVGLVTSGHFAKRGLDTFLTAARLVARSRPDARFLVAGSGSLPPAAAADPLVRDGIVLYRRKTSTPEHLYAALDVFMYPAVFEEFGLVVTEAQAMGIPLVVSERVGAAETLPPDYAGRGVATHDAEAFATRCLELLEDPQLRARLAAAAAASVVAFDSTRYATATAATILSQKLRLR